MPPIRLKPHSTTRVRGFSKEHLIGVSVLKRARGLGNQLKDPDDSKRKMEVTPVVLQEIYALAVRWKAPTNLQSEMSKDFFLPSFLSRLFYRLLTVELSVTESPLKLTSTNSETTSGPPATNHTYLSQRNRRLHMASSFSRPFPSKDCQQEPYYSLTPSRQIRSQRI